MAKHEYVGGGWAGARGEATGFFHVEEIDGRWWMIDPVGDAFFVVGTDHVSYDGPRCEALGYSPYHRACQAKYGSEKAWAAAAARRLRAWGFNNVGAGAAASMRYRGLTHTEFISFGHGYAGIDAIAPQRWWTGFPNVFAKGFVDYCDRRAHETCRPNRRDPWLVGYFLDNELEWYGSYGDTFGQFDVGSSLLTDAMSLAPRNAARLAAVRLLQRRHATAASFNRAWETSIADVREIAALPSLPRPQTPAAQADAVEYLRLCAEKYFAITSAAVREHDPNHMVLGCRFAGSARGFMDIVGKHCDIVSINCYRYLDLGLGKFMDGFEDQLGIINRTAVELARKMAAGKNVFVAASIGPLTAPDRENPPTAEEREAAQCAPQFGDRRSYQMDARAPRQAPLEAALDVSEGADMLMVKPAAAYLDLIAAVRAKLDHPLAAYHVSGEYSMIKAAARNGWLDEKAAAMEITSAIRRAGADLIITYFAEDLAGWLK